MSKVECQKSKSERYEIGITDECLHEYEIHNGNQPVKWNGKKKLIKKFEIRNYVF